MAQGLAQKKCSKVDAQGMDNERRVNKGGRVSRVAVGLGLMPSQDPVDTRLRGELLPEP